MSVLSAVAACTGASWAQAPGSTGGRITIAVGGQAVLYHLPLTIADRLGFFQAEGLEPLHDELEYRRMFFLL